MTSHFRVYETPLVRRRSFMSYWFSSLSATTWLIFFNVLFFIIALLLGAGSNADCGKSFCNFLAIQANNLFINGFFWTLLTSMFSHILFFHLFVNMLSLYFIGKFLEMLIGKKRFLWFYIFSGIFAGAFFALLAFLFGDSSVGARVFGSADTFAVGASGAIFGIAGVLALLTPRNRVSFIAGPLIALILGLIISPFTNSIWGGVLDSILTIYFLVAIFSMLSPNLRFRKISLPVDMPLWVLPIVAIIPLILISLVIDLPIGNMAHLGGFIAGACYGLYLRLRYKQKTKRISEYFSG